MAACADAWATEFPAELYLMSGHSCDWRQREGRCSDRSVAIKCAKTCELCGPEAFARRGTPAVTGSSSLQNCDLTYV